MHRFSVIIQTPTVSVGHHESSPRNSVFSSFGLIQTIYKKPVRNRKIKKMFGQKIGLEENTAARVVMERGIGK